MLSTLTRRKPHKGRKPLLRTSYMFFDDELAEDLDVSEKECGESNNVGETTIKDAERQNGILWLAESRTDRLRLS